MKSIAINIFFILFSVGTLLAQMLPDSTIVQLGKMNALFLYDRATEGTHHLYNGSEYIEYQPLDEEHPYFISDDWALGDVKYSGQSFSSVPILFDIQKGKLIGSYYYKGIKMQWVNDWVGEFSLEGHRFINFKNTTDSLFMKNGFYELLYDGETMVLARRVKEYKQRIEGVEEFRRFDISDQYFLKTRGRFFRISNRRDMVSTLAINKKELQSFIRQNNLFDNNKEASIVQLAKYFDSLKP